MGWSDWRWQEEMFQGLSQEVPSWLGWDFPGILVNATGHGGALVHLLDKFLRLILNPGHENTVSAIFLCKKDTNKCLRLLPLSYLTLTRFIWSPHLCKPSNFDLSLFFTKCKYFLHHEGLSKLRSHRNIILLQTRKLTRLNHWKPIIAKEVTMSLQLLVTLRLSFFKPNSFHNTLLTGG